MDDPEVVLNEASDLCAFTGCKTSLLTVLPESQCHLEYRPPCKNTAKQSTNGKAEIY